MFNSYKHSSTNFHYKYYSSSLFHSISNYSSLLFHSISLKSLIYRFEFDSLDLSYETISNSRFSSTIYIIFSSVKQDQLLGIRIVPLSFILIVCQSFVSSVLQPHNKIIIKIMIAINFFTLITSYLIFRVVPAEASGSQNACRRTVRLPSLPTTEVMGNGQV